MKRFQNLKKSDLDLNPFSQFNLWYEDAKKHVPLYPEAMCLSTIDKKGYPRSRYVLFRGFKPPIFQFYTNYNSDKGNQLLNNPKACLLFYWKDIGRQIRITGQADKSSADESDAYWSSRPFESQIHALSSDQSHTLKDFEKYLERIESLENQFKNKSVPRPENWGGFDFTAENFEFWQEGECRLHQRFTYKQSSKDLWDIKQLYP